MDCEKFRCLLIAVVLTFMSRSILDPRLCFIAEYVDEMANLTREFQLLYFYDDNSVELRELKTKKIFLRRIQSPGLTREQFFLGGNVMVFGRVMRLTRFGDEVTRQLCEESAEYTTMIFSEPLFSKLGSILAVLVEECGFSVKDMNTVVLSPTAVEMAGLSPSLGHARAAVVQAVRRQAVECGKEFASRIGRHVSVASDLKTAQQWQSLLREPSAAIQGDYQTSMILLKPHALQKNLGGQIIQFFLDQGLSLAAIRAVSLSPHNADFLIQPYKGVLADYQATVDSISGNSWVVQFASTNSVEALPTVRSICGPYDPAIAKALVPKSIRARFGVDRVNNAVHCVDVAEDSIVYPQFFFDTTN